MFEKEKLQLEIEEIDDIIDRLNFQHQQNNKIFVREMKTYEFLLKEKTIELNSLE